MIIIKFICAVIDIYIIKPIKRWFNFHFKHRYIPDNPRNNAALEYFFKVMENPEYQPSTPNEIYFERIIKEEYFTSFPEATDENWTRERPFIMMSMADELTDYEWVDDRHYED